MPCAAPSRNNMRVQGPCGYETYAAGLCKPHWQMLNGLAAPTVYSSVSLAVLADSPNGYWRLNEPVGATSILDSSGKANPGAVGAGGVATFPALGTVTFGSPGVIPGETAVALNPGYFTVPDANSLDLADTFTCEAWVMPASAVGALNILSKGNGTFLFRLETTTRFVGLIRQQTAAIVVSTTAVPIDGKFHHVAVTKSGATVRLYLDGVDVTGTVTNQTMVDTTSPLGIGWEVNQSVPGVFGSLAHVACYPTALSAARILAHYQAASDPLSVLLLHCDGPDASTVFVDASPSGKAVAVNGNAQIDTAQFKFGTSSALFDGTTDWLQVADSPDFDFGVGDFTIDFWIRPNSIVGGHYPLAKIFGGLGPFAFFQSGAAFYFYCSGDGVTWNIAQDKTISASLVAGTWYHVAVVRQGQTFTAYLNGAVASTWTSALAVVANNNPVTIGAAPFGSTAFDGWMDEIRISKGIARWSGPFSPPTAPY